MSVGDFYSSVFPSEGLLALAVFKNGLGSPPTHYFYDSVEDFMEGAKAYDKGQKNVYHGCAAYKTGASRKGDNVHSVKALWLDLDVGPTKPYINQRDAAQDVANFTSSLGLPPPHFVKSGGGLHVYYPLEAAIQPDKWQRLAAAFATCLDHFGVKHDSSRTQDIASILRVPGTRNYKTNPPRDVALLKLGQAATAATLYQKLDAYAKANCLILLGGPPKKAAAIDKETADLIGIKDYPPSDGELVAKSCPIIEEVDRTGGDVPYEIWWRSIGVAKHVKTPDETAEHWTRERAATGHDKTDWAKAIGAWTVGPTTCSDFSKHSDKCTSCRHNGRITSPIQLGVELLEQDPIPGVELSKEQEHGWEFGAQWIRDEVARRHNIYYKNGRLFYHYKRGDEVIDVQICDRYWQVLRRIRSPEHIWQLEIGYASYKNEPHKTFLLDSAAVTTPDMLRKAFSARELHIFGGAKSMQYAQQKIMAEQELLFSIQAETPTIPTMGWSTKIHAIGSPITGEFVLGDTLFRPNKAPKDVLLSDIVISELKQFESAGTTADWVRLINEVYNRPGAEAYQFVIAAAFASPLVRLTPDMGTWHGIPIALTGPSGAAKTTMALVAMSLYTKPTALQFNGNQDPKNGGQGDTTNSLTQKLGALKNLPCLVDEMTSLPPETLSTMMYMLANGKGKTRMGPNGRIIETNYHWDMLSFITGNDDFHEKLKLVANQFTQEATQIRCFQIPLKVETLQNVFAGNSVNVLSEICGQQYGMAGRDWLQFVVDNRDSIQLNLTKAMDKYNVASAGTTSVRFYKQLIATVHVAAMYAKAAGFIQWDVKKMIDWARAHMGDLQSSVFDREWHGVISDFVASLHGRTIVTKHLKLGPGRRSANPEFPLENLSTSHSPVARKAIDDRLFVVTANALVDWAKDKKIMPRTLLEAMDAHGYLVRRVGSKLEPKMINIGSGTTITRPQAPCWELDYDKVAEFMAGDEADTTNVVPISVPTVVPVTPIASVAPQHSTTVT